MRAISVFTLEAGTSTFGWRALIALRTRVSISAMGSLVMNAPYSLPTGLHDAGNFTVQRELTEAEPAHAVLAQEAARAAAAPAAIPVAALELRRLLLLRRGQLNIFCDFRECCHLFCALLLPERHSHLLQKGASFGIGSRRGGDRDVHTLGLFDLRVIDLGENQLIPQAHRVVAAAVEGFRRNAAEVADTRKGHVQQPVQELVHAIAAQSNHRSDRHALAKLERCDGFLRLCDYGLLTRDRAEFVDRAVHQLGVAGGLAETDVDRDLFDLRHGHNVLVPELLRQG